MPNYRVTFSDGRQMTVWATDKEGAKAKAQTKYKPQDWQKGPHRKRHLGAPWPENPIHHALVAGSCFIGEAPRLSVQFAATVAVSDV
jgi:hypothetical protein